MTKLLAIARNTFLQTVRQPVFSVLILLTFGLLVLSVPLSGWTMSPTGEHKESDQRLMNNVGLSTILAAGMLIAAFAASSALSREIADGTALTVVAKPVSRATFVLGKYLGVAAAVTVAFYLCSLAFLMTVRHGVLPTAVEKIDWPVVVIACSMVGVAFVIALVGNFSFKWTFTSTMVWTTTICLTLAMAAIAVVGKEWKLVSFGEGIPGQLLIGVGLIYVAVLFLSAVAVAASTRLGQVPTLLVCIGVAVLGAYHSLLYFRWGHDHNLIIPLFAAGTPETRYFMTMDALTQNRPIPISFVGLSAAYGACFIAAALAIGCALFQSRQLEGQQTSAAVPAPVSGMSWLGRAVAVLSVLAGIIVAADPCAWSGRGFSLAAALVVGGVVGWVLWGLFARGVKWTYWLIAPLSTMALIAAIVSLVLNDTIKPDRFGLLKGDLFVIAIVAATVALVCLLPRTRRHFRSSGRLGRISLRTDG